MSHETMFTLPHTMTAFVRTKFIFVMLSTGLAFAADVPTAKKSDAKKPTAAKPDFKRMAQEIKPWVIEVRKDIHRHPELGFEETRTSNKVKEFLRAEGIEFKEMAKTGISAIIRGGRPGATVAIRADMDALPVLDLKKVDYASLNKGNYDKEC